MADVVEDEANEHEEQADQREGGGRTDHLYTGRNTGRQQNTAINQENHS